MLHFSFWGLGLISAFTHRAPSHGRGDHFHRSGAGVRGLGVISSPKLSKPCPYGHRTYLLFRHSTIHCINDRINLPRCGLTDIGSWAYKLFWALGSGLRLRCRVKLFQSRLSEVVGPPPISSAEYGSQSLSRTCRARTHLQAFSLSLSGIGADQSPRASCPPDALSG